MTQAKRSNTAASIRQRLLDLARERQIDFNLILTRYGLERFLYRLSISEYSDRFVLKGAMLFPLWGVPSYRQTRDIDLLGFGESDIKTLEAIFRNICMTAAEDDGMRFDPETVQAEDIRDQMEYGGVRLKLNATLDGARIHIQVDIGFGDAVTPDAVSGDFPTLLGLSAPHLKVYPRETVVAEKYQAMVQLGIANSRMKDFYDLWMLSEKIKFKGEVLKDAIRRTFEHRDTDIPENEPVAFSERFASDKQDLWLAFVRTSSIKDAPEQMETVIAHLRKFIFPVFDSIRTDMKFTKTWSADGPWK